MNARQAEAIETAESPFVTRGGPDPTTASRHVVEPAVGIARCRVTSDRAGKRLDTENCYAFRFVDGLPRERCSSPTRSTSTSFWS
jgi:hypothetical protein